MTTHRDRFRRRLHLQPGTQPYGSRIRDCQLEVNQKDDVSTLDHKPRCSAVAKRTSDAFAPPDRSPVQSDLPRAKTGPTHADHLSPSNHADTRMPIGPTIYGDSRHRQKKSKRTPRRSPPHPSLNFGDGHSLRRHGLTREWRKDQTGLASGSSIRTADNNHLSRSRAAPHRGTRRATSAPKDSCVCASWKPSGVQVQVIDEVQQTSSPAYREPAPMS